jgi:DNA-binding transcriptional MerR regulator
MPFLGIAFAKHEVKVEVKGRKTGEENAKNSNNRRKAMEQKNQLFSILQISERLNIPKHTLRFWEKELNGVVVPLRTHGGQRRYTAQNLLILEEIKRCRESGLSLPEIGERIHRGGEKEEVPSSKIDLLATRVAEVVKTEVYNFFKKDKG